MVRFIFGEGYKFIVNDVLMEFSFFVMKRDLNECGS